MKPEAVFITIDGLACTGEEPNWQTFCRMIRPSPRTGRYANKNIGTRIYINQGVRDEAGRAIYREMRKGDLVNFGDLMRP